MRVGVTEMACQPTAIIILVAEPTCYSVLLKRGNEVFPRCGLEISDERLAQFPPAIAVGGGASHPLWKNVPGRQRPMFAKGWRYDGATGVWMLKNVSRSIENACAFSFLEALDASGVNLGEDLGDHVCGGVLALNQLAPEVNDACLLCHWHDNGACCSCGGRGHLASACPIKYQGLPGTRALRENLAAAENGIRAAQEALRVAEVAYAVQEVTARQQGPEESVRPALPAEARVRRRLRGKQSNPQQELANHVAVYATSDQCR